MAVGRYVLAALALGCAAGAQVDVPKSLSELPKDQYAIHGLAGVKVVSMPLQVECTDNPTVIVGVRFTSSAKRVRYARALSVNESGRTLSTSRRLENSSWWRFATLRLTQGCGVLHEVHYAFHRKGDRRGQRLGNHVCVLGANGERCPVPAGGE